MPDPQPTEQSFGQHLKSHRAPTFIPTLRVLGASLPFKESLCTFILESCHTAVVSFLLSSIWVLGMPQLQRPQSLRAAIFLELL
uniref:Uncharacterized protein n=1 Tax=Sus scrofa TaxID=9823 RepID=A0A8D1K690_PIG